MDKLGGKNIGFIRATGLKLAGPDPTGFWQTVVKDFKAAYHAAKKP